MMVTSQTHTVDGKNFCAEIRSNSGWASQQTGDGYQVIFRADPTIYDGRFAIMLASGIAQAPDEDHLGQRRHGERCHRQKLGVSAPNYEEGKHGREAYVDVVRLSHGDRQIVKTVPVLRHATDSLDDVITLHLGYGER
jgi:hypothetical protein